MLIRYVSTASFCCNTIAFIDLINYKTIIHFVTGGLQHFWNEGNLFSPLLPSEVSYKEIVQLLVRHFRPTPTLSFESLGII